MADEDLLALRFPLLQFTKDGGRSWTIGRAMPTKKGDGIFCTINPGAGVRGPFYIVMNKAVREQSAAKGHPQPTGKPGRLVKFSNYRKQSFDIGEAHYIDGGENVMCRLNPNFDLKGKFCFFP